MYICKYIRVLSGRALRENPEICSCCVRPSTAAANGTNVALKDLLELTTFKGSCFGLVVAVLKYYKYIDTPSHRRPLILYFTACYS